MADLKSQLRGLILTADELRLIPSLPPWFIEDYLTILENLVLLADTSDGKMELVFGAGADNIAIFSGSDGQVVDSGTTLDDIERKATARAYFYGRHF